MKSRLTEALLFSKMKSAAVTAYHLHFDISHSDTLRTKPWHWPDLTRYRQLKAQGVSTGSQQYRDAVAAIRRREVVTHYLGPLQAYEETIKFLAPHEPFLHGELLN
ncbi:MAG: hypothetical protein AB1345_11050 [Chloroflexota bacterium]